MKKEMKKTGRKIYIIMLLTLVIILPTTLAAAKREAVQIDIPNPPTAQVWTETPMPNGNTKLYAELVFDWYYEGEPVGTATQYIYGIIKYEEGVPMVAMLKGYGVYEATGDLSGTLTYTIGNNWDMVTNEIWAFRMRIAGGTGDFTGIKGKGVDDAYPHFLMYLNYNPWE